MEVKVKGCLSYMILMFINSHRCKMLPRYENRQDSLTQCHTAWGKRAIAPGGQLIVILTEYLSFSYYNTICFVFVDVFPDAYQYHL